ncbi:MAG: ATP-dependent DNA helicase RecG [Legionellales bacterium]|nr:ATP-dependent DNA helicase RecG [Legionellales bacterium]
MASTHLSSACSVLTGVGAQLSQRLAKLNIVTIKDILFHLPYRYEDRTRITAIANTLVGDHCVIEGTILKTEIKQRGRKNLLCYVKDDSGIIILRFIHFYPNLTQQLREDLKIRCYGEIKYGAMGLEMIHPEWQKIMPNRELKLDNALTPIYPSTEGISQARWRELMRQALSILAKDNSLTELLPQSIRDEFQLIDLISALNVIHAPAIDQSIELLNQGKHPAQVRLIFEELLVHQLSLLRLRQLLQTHHSAPMVSKGQLRQQFLAQLPFKLTTAQQRVSEEILLDLQKSLPMLRLVQGDVGCGKTVVAAIALLQGIESGFQTALMAPTEILAEQHYHNFQKWLAPLGISMAWLSGKIKGKARTAVLTAIATGQAQLIIGTHALFQEHVNFQRLGLLVIDEQHRFGVHQRLALREKGQFADFHPHQLVMSATPIPRTLAMLVYADLDCSIIDELPPGRKPVQTVVVPNLKRDQVIARVKEVCEQQRQAYWVCTLIAESELLQCQAAEKTADDLQQALPNLKIGLIHGRMKPHEKDAIMQEFKAGHIQILVATTVIEVGVDVPNASLMIIENPERLGLSQLHQLRGRVGRGAVESYCVLLYQSPLSATAQTRLQVLRDSHDGFAIAQHDLTLRGAGEVLGTRQTGEVKFRLADLQRDQALLPTVQQLAQKLMQDTTIDIEYLIQRWLVNSDQYIHV